MTETFILTKILSEDKSRISGNGSFPAPRKIDVGREVVITRKCITWQGCLGYFKDDNSKETVAFWDDELTSKIKHIPMERWGKDHWSTLAYLETLAVDNKGKAIPDGRRMRTILKKHPFSTNTYDSTKYPTRLKDGKETKNHDDWDCIEDMIREGLLVEKKKNKSFKFTKKGIKIAQSLREFKIKGGNFGDFIPS